MPAIYNDIEPYAVELLKLRIKDGLLPSGLVTDEDIKTLCQKDLSEHSHVHLYAGIGGFPLGCRMAGLPDEFRIFTAGFPCQPFSSAGRRAGSKDSRYLWPETIAAMRSHRPDVAILENVVGLTTMAFPSPPSVLDIKAYSKFIFDYFYRKRELGVLNQICEDIEQAGYTFQVVIIPACGVNARHERARLWIICFRNGFMENADGSKWRPRQSSGHDADGQDAKRQETTSGVEPSSQNGGKQSLANPDKINAQRNKPGGGIPQERKEPRKRQTGFRHRIFRRLQWATEPRVGRLVNGLSGRVDRVKGLGNAVVPQVVAELVSIIMDVFYVDPVFHPVPKTEHELPQGWHNEHS